MQGRRFTSSSDLSSLVRLQLPENEAGEVRGGAVDAASERGGTLQFEISDEEDGDDSEAGLEAMGRTGARMFEGSVPRDGAGDDVVTDEAPAGSRDETTEPEEDKSRRREERPPSEASEGNRSREHDGPNGRTSYDSDRVTRTDAAAVFGLKIGFENELRAS